MIAYVRTEDIDASEVQQALEAGRAVLVHRTSRYAYLKCLAPVGFGEVLGHSLSELPTTVRRYYLRKHVRRRITTVLEDGTEVEETLDLLVLPGEEQESDEVLGEHEAARFAGE